MKTNRTPRLFLHGWGQAPSVWQAAEIANREDDILLPLPGHGGAEDVTVTAWLDWLCAQLPLTPVHLVGWSLGAMLAMQLAQRLPQRVTSLTLYAATPCFCCNNSWSNGVSTAQLELIGDSVCGAKKEQGLTHFTRLMLHGEIRGRAALQQASTQHLANIPLPTADGLAAGVTLLRTLDLREIIPTIHQPVTIIHGTDDAIVPIAAGRWLAQQLPQAQSHWRNGYGHMPWEKS
ncbi:MAG: alpha/beta fold hydrolase [Mariprofundales bacterium]